MPTPLQLKSGRENWAIYLLRGWKVLTRVYIKPHVPIAVTNSLLNAIDDSIAIIKYRQQERNEK